nr:ribonuclease III [Saprospiraceae bacterium]
MRKVYNLTLSPDKEFARQIKLISGVTPRDLKLYKVAFYHSSGKNNRAEGVQNNERLEFLGDAILGCAVAEYLFKKYPVANEGFLTKMRSKIVKRQTLNEIAEHMGLDILLLNYNQTKLSKSMLGNALEALLGAFYLENGFEKTKVFIISKILHQELDIEGLESVDDNFKSQLLEWAQKEGKSIKYKIEEKYKENKRDRFKIGVLIDGKKVSNGEDYSKKSAEQLASKNALEMLEINTSEEE